MTAYQLDYYELVELAREKHRMRVSHIALPRIVGNINLYMLLYKFVAYTCRESAFVTSGTETMKLPFIRNGNIS